MADLFGAAIGLGLISAIFLFFIAIYAYVALALMTIANKTNTPKSFLAWIPIANIFLMTSIGKLHWGWALALILVEFIPFAGPLASIIIGLFIWYKIIIALNKPAWYVILMIIPIVNFIMIGVLAWGD